MDIVLERVLIACLLISRLLMERDNVNLTLSISLTIREFTYLGLIHGHLKWDGEWREREIDITQVSKNVTYEMYIE